MSRDIISTATEIVTIEQLNAVIATSRTDLGSLISKHGDVPLEPKNATELAKVDAAWREFYYPRLEIEKKVKGAVSNAYSQYKDIKATGEEIVGRWKEQEDKFKAILNAEDERKKAEKAARADAELQRLKTIRAKIDAMRNIPLDEALSDSDRLQLVLDDLESRVLSDAEYAEFQAEASDVLKVAANKLQDMLTARLHAEQVAAQQKAEAERLAKERAEFEAEKAAQEAAERKRRADEQARIDAETARIKAEQEAQRKVIAAQQAEIDRKNAELKAKQDEAERIERERIEAEAKAEAEEAAKAAKAEAERLRLQRLAEEDEAEEHYAAHIRVMLGDETTWAIVRDALRDKRYQYALDIATHQAG